MSEPTKQYLDERVIYVFIRQDVEMKHQLVQALHAMRKATMTYVGDIELLHALGNPGMREKLHGIPFLTAVGMPDKPSMDRVVAKCKDKVHLTQLHDTDYEFGIVAMVTEPLPLSVREKPDGLMCNYRLWNPANNTAEATMSSRKVAMDAYQVLGAVWGLAKGEEERCRIMNYFYAIAASGIADKPLFPLQIKPEPVSPEPGRALALTNNHGLFEFRGLDCPYCHKPIALWAEQFKGSATRIMHVRHVETESAKCTIEVPA